MRSLFDFLDNITVPLILAFIAVAIRRVHDKYHGVAESFLSYLMRLLMGALFTILWSFIMNKNMSLWGIDLYALCIFFVGLFGMEICRFLMDKEVAKDFTRYGKKFLIRKIEENV